MSYVAMNMGRLGTGKSRFGQELVADELLNGDRWIVTSLPLVMVNPDEDHISWQEWCHRYSKRPIDTFKRIFILTPEQMARFWEYFPVGDFTSKELFEMRCDSVRNGDPISPSRGFKLPMKPHFEQKDVMVPDYDVLRRCEKYRGVHWIIDEAHITFSARYFYKQVDAATQAEYFFSYIRKLNGDLDLFSQDAEKVDKNFRRNLTIWREVVNQGKIKLLMGVGLKNRFRINEYWSPEMPDYKATPDKTYTYRLADRDLHKTYYTMSGVGLSGGMASVKHEKLSWVGRSPIVWVFALVAICVGCLLFPHVMAYITKKGIHSYLGVAESGEASHVVQPSVVAPPATSSNTSVRVLPTVAPVADRNLWQPSPNGVECIGYSPVDGTNVLVMLSDGRIADSHYGEVLGIGRSFVRLYPSPSNPGGQVFPVRQNFVQSPTPVVQHNVILQGRQMQRVFN